MDPEDKKKLKEFKELADEGLLDANEFKAMKAALLERLKASFTR